MKDEDHMPPKEKPQLTEQELKLLRLWITTGADFNKSISNFFTKTQLDSAFGHQNEVIDIPAKEPSSPDWNLVNLLIKKGVSITAVALGSNFLSVSFISVPKDASKLLNELIPVRTNVVWMKLSNCEIGDESMATLNQFNNLTRLSLDNTKVLDNGLTEISSLSELVFLNLRGTSVTVDGVKKLVKLAKLNNLYLYQTKIIESDRQKLKSIFKSAKIDFGDYVVPTLVSDTTEVKPVKK